MRAPARLGRGRLGRAGLAALLICAGTGAAAIAVGVSGASAAAVGLGVASVASLRIALLFLRTGVVRPP
ncbi:hypothetical protein DN069_33420 [Streptacidiphilus pinicola]|uniref:Uncharacterized protein n=1 Tax=Streptacidiphilus pinicola TaxID=2219663 RepID=A0A2X0J1P3_9ACTN|nr:hypothetical protein [Streptacidiphilus pinicola]RAG81298.1 hypothetical protein DN069_33420 [Streptacidiphilus pinicola]